MGKHNKWVDISILGLCMVGFTGMIMRSKIVFALPLINYNHLIEAHSHFTFGGWVTLALMTLMVHELLPPALSKKTIYQWFLGIIAFSSWGMLVAYFLNGYASFSIIWSFIFILTGFVFSIVFISDLLKTNLGKVPKLLAIVSLICLVLSSSGTFYIAYIYFAKSFDAILYRDALFTYLHFQYNGFFSLAIFSILFNQILKNVERNRRVQKNIDRFSIWLCVSILPSLFLTYLWQNPNNWFRALAILGSVLLLMVCAWFIMAAKSFQRIFFEERPVTRFLILISMGSFLLKTFLQCFTIFPLIGNAIFGNRPIIMGFLHLVFLAFTSLFLLAYFSKNGLLDETKRFTRIALMVFAIAILLNEITLISQGLTTMLMPGSNLFPWALWVIGICLFSGAVLVAASRFMTNKNNRLLIR
ncbi:MAG: hypothetical protein JST58_14985 [Bacteroidetes bacterium]|nr:hypothetical protein [Bacteroidota bacterium]